MAENRELALVLKLVADQFQNELKNSQGALSSFNSFIKDWRTQLAAAGTALFAVAKSAANYGDELFKTSQKVGIQVEALAGLQYAARLADVDTQQLQKGLQALSRAMVDSAQGTGEGKEAFARIGLSATDATGKLRPMQDVLLDMADVFSQSADGAGKTEVAMKLLGKSGVELIPLLNSGKAGIQQLMAEAERLGLVISTKDAAAAEEFNDALTRLDAQAKGFALSLGNSVIPLLSEFMHTMQDLTGGPIGKLFKLEIQGLASIFTLLGHAVKETALEVEIFFKKIGKSDAVKKFYDDVLAESRKALDRDTDKRLHGIFQDQLGKQGGREVHLGVSRPGIATGGGTADVGKEQERLGKALLEIYLSQNRALEIRNRLLSEAEDAAIQEGLGRRIVRDTQELLEEQADDGAIQEGLGRRIVRETQLLQIGREQEQLGRQIVQQTQAQLAIDAQRQAASMTFFDQWQAGLQKYLQDTQSGFGFAADLARRTAQMMEGAFRTFFFDLMDNKIKSLKDLFSSFANFAKQIIAQVLAQLATMMVLKGLTGGFGGFGLGGLSGLLGGGGFGAAKFAEGGPVLGAGNRDSVRAMLTPGEGVLNRKGMQALAQLNSGSAASGGSGPTNITINMHNSGRTDQPAVNFRRQMHGMVMDIIWRDPDFRQMLGGRG